MKKRVYIILRTKNILAIILVAVLLASIAHLSRNYFITVGTDIIDSSQRITVIVDAGHGGEDGGTQSKRGVLEKDINLDIAFKINDILKALDVDTVLVRDGDYLLYNSDEETIRQKKVADIRKRTEMANGKENSILLSIHQNYYSESKYSGAQIFFSPNNPLSEDIARSVQTAIAESLQKDNDRKIKKSGEDIYLLYHATVPAIMVECGFLSNDAEAELLCDEEYQQKIALAIVDGISNYI